jgi:hypothetical protein
MVQECGMLHLFLTLTTDKMTQSRWHEFNDMEHLVNKWLQICYGKILLWNV